MDYSVLSISEFKAFPVLEEGELKIKKMKETCVFCKKNHLPIHSIFYEIITSDNLESEKIINFTKVVENELKQNHWNEVFCMITVLSNLFKIPQNTTDILFFLTLTNIANCILRYPELNKIKKFMKNLTSQLQKISIEQDLRQKPTDNTENFTVEMDRLDKIIEELKNGSNIESSLKNYVVYRLMTFFEYKTFDTLRLAIDGKDHNSEDITYGKTIIGKGEGLLERMDSTITLVLQHKIFENKDNKFKLNTEASFFEFFGSVIKITSPNLQIFFEQNFHNDWYNLMKILKDERNEMTHNMNDVSYDIDKIENVLKLTQVFFYGFPQVLAVLLEMITRMNYDESISEYYESVAAIINQLDAQIISVNDFFNLSIQHFDGEFKKGVVKFFNESKGFGFIEREKDDDLHVSKKNITERINEGDKVEFLIGKGFKGPEARQVKKIT